MVWGGGGIIVKLSLRQIRNGFRTIIGYFADQHEAVGIYPQLVEEVPHQP